MAYDGQAYTGGSASFQEFGPNRGTYQEPQQNQPQQPLPNFQQQQPLNQLNQGQTSPQPHNQYQNNSYVHNNSQQTPGAVPMSPNAYPTQAQSGHQNPMQAHPWQQSMNQTQNFMNQIGVLQNNPFFQNKMRKFPGFQQGMQGQGQGSQPFAGGMPQNAGQQPLWGQSPSQYPGNNITTSV